MLLKEARKAKGLTIEKLRRLSGVDRETLSEIERGSRQPTSVMAWKLCEPLQLDASDIEEFQGVERPGDPCPCAPCSETRKSHGYGGVKVLPDSSWSRYLWVSLPCCVCKTERTYKKPSDYHSPYCRTCYSRRRTWKPRVEPFAPGQAFHAAFVAALDRKGITRQEAATLAGLRPGTIYSWERGHSIPGLPSLQALADALDATELITAIPSKVPVIQMRCEHCGTVKDYLPNIIRGEVKRGMFQGAIIDYTTGVGTYPNCGTCAMRARGRARYRENTHKSGKDVFNAEFAEMGRQVITNTPPEIRAERLSKAHAVVKGSYRTEEQKITSSASLIKPTNAGKWGICRICKDLTFTYNIDAPAAAHYPCLQKYKKDYQTTKFGRSSPPVYPSRPKGYVHSTEYLALSFELCVRHLLRDEPIFTVPDSPKGYGLAIKLGVDPRSVSDRIREFVKRLPPEGTGSKKLNLWRKVFLKAAREKYHYKI